jgi:hypothetical protein
VLSFPISSGEIRLFRGLTGAQLAHGDAAIASGRGLVPAGAQSEVDDETAEYGDASDWQEKGDAEEGREPPTPGS